MAEAPVRRLLAGLCLVLGACGEPPPPAAATAVSDLSNAAEVTTVDSEQLDAVAEVAAETGEDAATGPSPACVQACGNFAVCGEAFAVADCEKGCDDAALGPAVKECLQNYSDCEEIIACTAAAEPAKPALREFDFGAKNTFAWKELAGDFAIPTDKGEWIFSQQYDGHSSYVFVFMGRGWYKTQDGKDYLDMLWYGATKNDLKQMLDWSPGNVHYFFIGYKDNSTKDDSAAHITAMRDKLNIVLGGMAPKLRGQWMKRLHYAMMRAPGPKDPPKDKETLGGWLGAYTAKSLPGSFSIDRYQKLRQIGLLSIVGNPKPLLQHVAWEARYFNFEWKQAADYPEKDVKILTLLDSKPTGGETIDLQLPDKAEMAKYDTLEIDLAQQCKDHDQKNCFEWDYKSDLRVAERPQEPVNADADKACQPAVQATVTIAADTLPCTCITPRQELVQRKKVCEYNVAPKGSDPGKTGYSACQCQNVARIQRWITTYHREGRWITDASRALYYLNQGGTVRLQFNGAYPYTTTLKFRLRSKGKGGAPSQIVPLFEGGGFGEKYNDKYQPKQVEIPATAKRVELVLDVSGHGFGKDTANCAEFCNHTHHFTVNGKEYVRTQPYVGDNYGCAKQIDFGVVPNQFGTWTLGRGGWCPGYEVPVTTWDISGQAPGGKAVTISYKGMLAEKPYKPIPFDAASGGFGGDIDMASWVLIYE